MRTTMFLALATALTFSAPLAAKTGAATKAELAESKAAKADEGERKICKRLATSGTRMADRVCMTKEQWKQAEEQARG